MIDPRRFQRAIERFDAANAEDPHLIDGQPAELLYARRMTAWLARVYPDASEAVQLAARCQHIRRWMIPRSDYPMTRVGYHRWRTTLYTFHADIAADILKEVGYDAEIIARVRTLLRKEKLKSDPDMQALEDVICLVFLDSYFADFASRHEEQKVIGILRRTWLKMSARGHAAALLLHLPPSARFLLDKALSPQSPANDPGRGTHES